MVKYSRIKLVNPIVQEMLKNGIKATIELNRKTKKIEYIVEGFYKSGTITLFELENGNLMARARYNEETAINTFNDLVYLNYEWWIYSRSRFDGWEDPNPQWLPHLINANLLKSETKYTPNNG